VVPPPFLAPAAERCAFTCVLSIEISPRMLPAAARRSKMCFYTPLALQRL
jgi:hypothetical protein